MKHLRIHRIVLIADAASSTFVSDRSAWYHTGQNRENTAVKYQMPTLRQQVKLDLKHQIETNINGQLIFSWAYTANTCMHRAYTHTAYAFADCFDSIHFPCIPLKNICHVSFSLSIEKQHRVTPYLCVQSCFKYQLYDCIFLSVSKIKQSFYHFKFIGLIEIYPSIMFLIILSGPVIRLRQKHKVQCNTQTSPPW